MFGEADTTPASDVETTPATDPGDSSDAAETPTADATETGSAQPSDPQAGQPRDGRGRFAQKQDGTPATETTPDGAQAEPAPENPDVAVAAPAEPDATLQTSDAAPKASPGANPNALPADRPFAFQHRKQQYAIEGAVLKADGSLVVPAASVQQVALMLTRAREHDVAFPRFRQELQRETADLKRQLDTRHAGVQAFERLLDPSPDGTPLDAETFLHRAFDFYQQLPAIRQQMLDEQLAEKDRTIAELRGQPLPPAGPPGQPAPATDAGPSADDITRFVHSNTLALLDEAPKALPEYAGFSPAELQAFAPELLQRAALYTRLATEADEEVWGDDARVGTVIIDPERFAKEFRLVTRDALVQKQSAAARAKVQPQVTAAAERNRAVLGQSKVPPVPKPGADGAAGTEAPEFESFDDYVAWSSGVRRPKSKT